MNKLQIQTFSSEELLSKSAEYLASRINSILEKYVNPIILVSGGSSVDLYLKTWPLITVKKAYTVGLVDERWLPLTQAGNNEKQLRESGFLELVKQTGGTFFGMVPPTMADISTPQEYATTLSRKYETTFETSSYQLILLGMGPDGHTAGWLPNNVPSIQKDFFENEDFVTYYELERSSNPFGKRITITAEPVKKADEVIVFAKGQEKAAAFTSFMSESGTFQLTPVRFLKTLTQPVTFLTDITL